MGLDVFCEGEINQLSLATSYSMIRWSDGTDTDNISVSESGTYGVTVTDDNGCSGTAIFSTTTIMPSVIEVDSLTCNPNIIGQFQSTLINDLGCEDILITNILLDLEFPNCSLMTGFRGIDVDCPELENGSFQLVSARGEYPIDWILKDINSVIIDTGTITEPNEIIDVMIPVGSYFIELTSADFLFKELDFDVRTREIDFSTRADTTILIGESVDLFANIDSLNLTSYNWFIDEEALCLENCDDITITPTETTTYRFEFLTRIGCTLSEEVTITVLQDEDLYIPNTFSPSSSAPNNAFNVLGPGSQLLLSMQVYDRWGNLVHNDDNPTQNSGWDGRINNQKAIPGLYLYKITFGQNGSVTTMSGQVTLLP